MLAKDHMADERKQAARFAFVCQSMPLSFAFAFNLVDDVLSHKHNANRFTISFASSSDMSSLNNVVKRTPTKLSRYKV